MLKKVLFAVLAGALAVGALPSSAQEIDNVCLVTDIGRINDGTFNQYAYEGMMRAVEEFDLDSSFIETTAETDYAANINTCIQSGAQIIVTVGFLIADATLTAAEENPNIYFIGVDQFVVDGPKNYVGIQSREDQAGFLVGALAALVAEDRDLSAVAGVYGVAPVAFPPAVEFRSGFEQGVRFINPDLPVLGTYIDSFVVPDYGAERAARFIGKGAGVIFGTGGPTGSGAIRAAAEAGVFVIGSDYDEYFTTFGGGETTGAEFLISSALKQVDVGVYDMIAAIVTGDLDAFPGGSNYILDVANGGIGFAPKHDADIDDAIYEAVEEILQKLIDEEITTGVDPATGNLIEEEQAEPTPDATPGS